jgi:hypothetical protein
MRVRQDHPRDLFDSLAAFLSFLTTAPLVFCSGSANLESEEGTDEHVS